MLESNVWGENSFLFIHTTWIGNDLLKIRKMNRAELILKTAYSSAIALSAILKTRSVRRLARCLLAAFLCAHIFIKRETSGHEAAKIMHQSIPPAPSPHPPPPSSELTPGHWHFFCSGWQNPGGGGLRAVQSSGAGTKKKGKCPVLRQHCNIFL